MPSYLAKPGSRVAHIPTPGGCWAPATVNRPDPHLTCLCSVWFPRPDLTSYWLGELDGRRVCKTCARRAVDIARQLILAATNTTTAERYARATARERYAAAR